MNKTVCRKITHAQRHKEGGEEGGADRRERGRRREREKAKGKSERGLILDTYCSVNFTFPYSLQREGETEERGREREGRKRE